MIFDRVFQAIAGMKKLERYETCRHPHHNTPTMISIPHGHGYVHVCPGCGNSVRIIGGM